ncbi:MAG: o-succinylbenzoate synthase [Lentisphaeria bacterium]|nr:o-succinylbenzoate synthase [Lentisphaeria bacterium]
MRIDRITMYRVCNPIKHPYTTSFGTQKAFNSLVVKMESEGFTGWGESAPWGCPAFSPYWDKGCFLLGKEFIVPKILHKEIGTPGELQKILEPIRGNEFAKGAFDVAFWDLWSRQQGITLKKAIGGTKEKAEIGYCFGVLKTFDELIAGIDRVTKMGYPRVKLKFCPTWECEMLDAVRSVYPRLTIHIDCNSAYTLQDLDMLKKLDKYDLAMIEQPLMHNDLIDHATLQKKIGTPICLDESICSLQDARQAIEIGACKFINIKYARVGGITPSLDIHALCGEKGIGCWMGGMGESSLGTTVVANLATLPYVNYPSDISPADKFYVENLGKPVLLTDQPGTYTLREKPGLDVEADKAVLDKYKQEEFSA